MAALTGSTPEGLEKLNEFLAAHQYANDGPLPSSEDARILSEIKGPVCRKTYPNVYHWYHFLNFFSPQAKASWGKKADGKKEHKKDAKDAKKQDKKEDKKGGKKEEKKETPAEDFDPFADDAPAEKEAPKPEAKKEAAKPAQKKEKKKAVAKTIVLFDVKVFDTETDLKALADRIYEINIDGLVWNREPKFIDVAFGIKKLQVGMVIEDEKVQTDDLYEKIESWEEVQSTDVVTMQKV